MKTVKIFKRILKFMKMVNSRIHENDESIFMDFKGLNGLP